MEAYNDELETEFFGADQMPESGVQVISVAELQQRAEKARAMAARVLEFYPGNDQGKLKPHADPFETAIEAEVA